MYSMKEMIKNFRNTLLTMYYAEGQDLDNIERKEFEKLLSIMDRLVNLAH